MSHHLDYSGIGWEAFEDLCIALWFDEGYADIRPYGRRGEGGRDAVFVDRSSRDLTIFQFKRWTGHYTASQIKSKIKKAAQKVAAFGPKRFIFNSAGAPNAGVNDWIPQLQSEVGFEIEYWDRSWTDLRLDNRRQDLRRFYFGLNLEHHTWASLLATTSAQIERALKGLSSKFNQDVYVEREVENTFGQFAQSNSLCLAIIDRAGSGKTNLVCALASRLQGQRKAAVLVNGDASLVDDHGLERIVCAALGYNSGSDRDCRSQLKEAARLLVENDARCCILLDGISENENVRRMARSLKNLLLCLSEVGRFQVCLTCRSVVWPIIEFGLPKECLYPVSSLTGVEGTDRYAYQASVGDFSEAELDLALARYCAKYSLTFSPASAARSQLKHPLLLRLFCESNRNQALGHIDSVPISSTFEHYLDMKAQAIEPCWTDVVVGSIWCYG
jgi:hypothetical protein